MVLAFALKYWKFILAGVALLAVLGIGYVYRESVISLFRQSEFDRKQAEFQDRIDELILKNNALEQDMTKAKRESALAYERSRLNAETALQWKNKYQIASNERDSLKRARTPNEAIAELRRMGWIK